MPVMCPHTNFKLGRTPSVPRVLGRLSNSERRCAERGQRGRGLFRQGFVRQERRNNHDRRPNGARRVCLQRGGTEETIRKFWCGVEVSKPAP